MIFNAVTIEAAMPSEFGQLLFRTKLRDIKQVLRNSLSSFSKNSVTSVKNSVLLLLVADEALLLLF